MTWFRKNDNEIGLVRCECCGHVLKGAHLPPPPDTAEEQWLSTPYPAYFVSSLGRVWSNRSKGGRLLKPGYLGDGYYMVKLGAGKTSIQVHVLVCEAFHGPRPAGMVARHLDGDRENNRADNLAWGTPTENAIDRIQHRSNEGGERHQKAIMRAEDVRRLVALALEGRTTRQLASEFGITQRYVRNILRGVAWRHLPETGKTGGASAINARGKGSRAVQQALVKAFGLSTRQAALIARVHHKTVAASVNATSPNITNWENRSDEERQKAISAAQHLLDEYQHVILRRTS